MGYTLRIGEAVVESNLEGRSAKVVVDVTSHPDAPLNSSDDHSNQISPSYVVWGEFYRLTGLNDIFLSEFWGGEEYGLLYRHPGAAALTEAHWMAFRKAKGDYLAKQAYVDDLVIRRLDWLIWWTRWALDNCKYPTFASS